MNVSGNNSTPTNMIEFFCPPPPPTTFAQVSPPQKFFHQDVTHNFDHFLGVWLVDFEFLNEVFKLALFFCVSFSQIVFSVLLVESEFFVHVQVEAKSE